MKFLDMQHEKETMEFDEIAKSLAKAGLSGAASEPTTPPEYHNQPSQHAVSRPALFSNTSVTSSPARARA